MAASRPHAALADIAACLGFYTRLPMLPHAHGVDFPAAQWAAPVAGAVVGLGVGVVLAAATGLGVPATVAAALALAAGIALTGALHEDGLADVADGFGGGRDREAKLAIMKDSRLGTYGALALGLSLLVRWAALAALAAQSTAAILIAAIAAHAASRAIVPAFMHRVPPARPDGLSAGMGAVEARVAAVAAGLGAALLLPGGLAFALVSILLLLAVFVSLERLCRRQIGGQTGDVLGALQQGGEIAVLAAAATLFVPS